MTAHNESYDSIERTRGARWTAPFAQAWEGPAYLARQAGLPDMGARASGPRPLTTADADAIHACNDPVALGEMSAYARSYFAVGGAVILGAAATVAASATRHGGLATLAAVGTAAAAIVVMEARRRARQWDALIDARLVTLAATSR